MKIEHLKSDSADCPLIRLYDLDAGELSALLSLAQELSCGTIDRAIVNKRANFPGSDDPVLEFRRTPHDLGVTRIGEKAFALSLSEETWATVQGLIEGVARTSDADTFQWLWGANSYVGGDKGAIAVLLSNSQAGLW